MPVRFVTSPRCPCSAEPRGDEAGQRHQHGGRRGDAQPRRDRQPRSRSRRAALARGRPRPGRPPPRPSARRGWPARSRPRPPGPRTEPSSEATPANAWPAAAARARPERDGGGAELRPGGRGREQDDQADDSRCDRPARVRQVDAHPERRARRPGGEAQRAAGATASRRCERTARSPIAASAPSAFQYVIGCSSRRSAVTDWLR